MTGASRRLNCACAGNGTSSEATPDSRKCSTDRSRKRSTRAILYRPAVAAVCDHRSSGDRKCDAAFGSAPTYGRRGDLRRGRQGRRQAVYKRNLLFVRQFVKRKKI